MIYVILACIVLVTLSIFVRRSVPNSVKWLRIVPLVIAPFINAANIGDFSLLIQPLLITSFIISLNENIVKKIIGLLPCLLLLNPEYLNLYVIFQVSYFAILFFEKRSSADLMFSTSLIFSALITNEYISSLLILLPLIVTLIEKEAFEKICIKRIIPILSVLLITKEQSLSFGPYIMVAYSIVAITYLSFSHKHNLMKNNMLGITSVLIFLVPGYKVISFIFLTIFFYEFFNVLLFSLRSKLKFELKLVKSIVSGVVVSPSILLALLVVSNTQEGALIAVMILICNLMTAVKISIEEIKDKNYFWGEIVGILVLVLILFPLNSIPTKFLYLVDQRMITSLEWGTLSLSVFFFSIVLLGLVGYMKFKLNLEKYLYKYNFLNQRRSEYYTFRVDKSFGEFESIIPRRVSTYERHIGLELLLLCSGFITKRFHVITWLIVLSLIFTMVYSI